MSVSIDIRRTKAKLAKLAREIQREKAGVVYEIAEEIMTDSKDNYVPLDLGTLKSTGHVEEPVVTPSNVTVRMGYGGPAAPYALAVHEHLSGYSPRSWRGNTDVQFTHGGPKYLEIPLIKRKRTFARDFTRKLKARTSL